MFRLGSVARFWGGYGTGLLRWHLNLIILNQSKDICAAWYYIYPVLHFCRSNIGFFSPSNSMLDIFRYPSHQNFLRYITCYMYIEFWNKKSQLRIPFPRESFLRYLVCTFLGGFFTCLYIEIAGG
ncbi:unnamed protein product [Amoebophrya sp. A25]|nr:unnamed protein product [Amoebophrya sp. A25]|eukprot:GSA25T00022550001.1